MKYRVKIVPENAPNSDGEWIEVEAPEVPPHTSWIRVADHFQPFVAAGHFVVKYEVIES